jgi:uncharacterized coiled-coil protein SlyX
MKTNHTTMENTHNISSAEEFKMLIDFAGQQLKAKEQLETELKKVKCISENQKSIIRGLTEQLTESEDTVERLESRIRSLEDTVRKMAKPEEDFIDGFLSEEEKLEILLEIKELMQ